MKLFFSLFFCFIITLNAQQTTINFSLETIEGDYVSLEQYLKEGPVYISFWALWCQPCRAELKVLQDIHKKFNKSGFNVVAINIDNTKSLAKVESFCSSQQFSFPVLLDPNSQVFRQFNGQALPYSLLINQQGEIVKIRTGYLPGDEKFIEEDIALLLNK